MQARLIVPQPSEAELVILKDRYMPKVLPATWRMITNGIDGNAYQGERPKLRVINSIERHLDGKLWLHVSLSRQDYIPDWDDLVFVKETFIGPETTVLQVLPPRSKWVSIHNHCLHLWHCLDGDVTPDFTQGGESI